MRHHAEYYKQFIHVHPGGGIRRNPKRKNAGAYSSPLPSLPPSPADVDRVFESHLTSMARGGTYGDNMEITAFASAYEVDVKIYQRDFAYMVTGGGGGHGEDGGPRSVAHIAYHVWEHYSSIRNLDGPHNGMPEVQPIVLSVEEERRQKEKLDRSSTVLPWQVDVVTKSLPFLADKITIRRALEAARGDINRAVSNLLESESEGTASSQPESSSIERDHDSDDDVQHAPNKKQDRRMSRASKAQRERIPRPYTSLLSAPRPAALVVPKTESVGSFSSDGSGAHPSSQQSTSTTESDSIEVRPRRSSWTNNHAVPTAVDRPASPVKPTIRLTLHPPKPPPAPSSSTARRSCPAPRVSARDRKDMKKLAQKAARKERQHATALALRSQRPAHTSPAAPPAAPPVETLRTLYI